jgi:hypothetical protein
VTSSDFGKLEVNRQAISGVLCAMAGIATAVEASPAVPAVIRNYRRFMKFPPVVSE